MNFLQDPNLSCGRSTKCFLFFQFRFRCTFPGTKIMQQKLYNNHPLVFKHQKPNKKLVCKGFTKFSMNNITLNDYLSCLNEQIPKHVQDYLIISKKQTLTTNYVQKMYDTVDLYN